ncbi:MAG: NUDIX domain-containing protein [Patescibacteria group bacterium]|nr:NUDIX domain-containing protein [Patescibacteria group bacterium]
MSIPKFIPKPGQIDYTHSKRAPVINCLVEFDGRILLVKRSKDLYFYPGIWNGIGGFLDDEKSPAEKAKEEIEEELNISPDKILKINIGEIFEMTDARYEKTWIIHPVHAVVATDKVRLDWEAEEYRWILPEDISKYDNAMSGLSGILDQFFNIR